MANTNSKTAAEAVQGGDKSVDLQNQVDSLTSENAALKNENGQLKGQVISLTGDRDTLASANQVLATTNESLTSDNHYLSEQLEEKKEELEQAQGIIEEQTAQLKTAEVGQALGPVVVTHEKLQYRVLVPRFSHAGNLVESTSLRQNPDLVRQLVEGGSGLLQQIETA